MSKPLVRLSLALALAAPLAAQTPNAPATPSPPPAAPAAPAAPPTDPEIWLADLVQESGALRIDRPRNLTRRAGYDNQPWFLPDGERLLYTVQRGEATDTWALDLATGTARAVTATPESEFSPQLGPDGASLVAVRVEADTTQRLWRFPLALRDLTVGAPALVAPEVKGVGYQAWLDARTVAVFVLGEPFTLQIVELGADGRANAKAVAEGIGRSIHRVPGTRQVSYVAADGGGRAIFAHDPSTGARRKLAPAPPTEEGDYAWLPDGSLLAGVGSTIRRCVPGPDAAWTSIADLTGERVGRITRIAVSPLGNQIAFVAER